MIRATTLVLAGVLAVLYGVSELPQEAEQATDGKGWWCGKEPSQRGKVRECLRWHTVCARIHEVDASGCEHRDAAWCVSYSDEHDPAKRFRACAPSERECQFLRESAQTWQSDVSACYPETNKN